MAIIYDKKDRIAYLTINRPEALNAMDHATWQEVLAAIEDFGGDDDSWVMIITGAGDKAFSVGADLKSVIPSVAAGETEIPPTVWFKDIYKPIIAAINGFCYAGAMEIVLATDIRIASENAVLGQVEAKWGAFTSGGGTVRLVRHLSWCHAMEILLTAEPITAQEAYRIGLVNRVVPLNELMPTAEAMARADMREWTLSGQGHQGSRSTGAEHAAGPGASPGVLHGREDIQKRRCPRRPPGLRRKAEA